ncbi:DUF4132 domain-containing protein [Micromonospora sp. M61]|uniref:DUF4132 domain-containing protein n=1 Tax=Micromonospora sp. M61 TaxID=2824890 RepID=UPI001B36F265|nr:DUF4132 domain-containing protein [Micromonospora sp. M61]MBQ0977462.1 DUF4132 domain-containing protein [Micromonospora sp. M61]
MRRFVMPDEDAWHMPKDWSGRVHPRRGGRWRPAIADPAGAEQRLRDLLATDKAAKQRASVLGRNAVFDTALLAAGERHLRTLDDAPIAAAVAALLTVYRNVPADGQGLVDGWVARAGLLFAVRAVVAANQICHTGELWTRASEGDTYEQGWRGDDLGATYAVARAVRRHLAVASDRDYREAESVLAEHRSFPAGRILASYLMPTRQDWVDEDCAAAAAWFDEPGREEWIQADHRTMSGILLLAASRTEHLEQLRGAIRPTLLGFEEPGDALTVLDGVGPAAVTFLAGEFYLELLYLHEWNGLNQPTRLNPDAARFVAGTPSDDAMRILVRDHLDEKPWRPGNLLKSGVLTRYPLRVLRVLAERDDAVSRDLFGAMVLTEPRWIPHLAGPGRARAEEIVANGGAGLGAGWATMLDQQDYYRGIDGADNVRRAVAALAAIPTEEAFGLVVDRVERQYFRPALLAAAKRDPGTALRALLTSATEPLVIELLRDHVLAYPQSVATLDDDGRARVQAIAGLPSPGPRGVVPPVLAGVLPQEPDLPEWLIPAKLAEVTVRDTGERLAPEAVHRLCVLLALSTITEPRPELIAARDICEPRQLGAFAWAVLEQWRAAEYSPKSGIALVSIAALGDDTTVADLVAVLPQWSSASARIRAAMDVLAAIGTDFALTQLHRLSRRASTAGLREHASQRLAGTAAARGLSPEQLADRIVPDLGLDADGRTILDYGPRRFTVDLDEQLQPWIAASDGRRLSRLPRPAATDDPVLAPAAYARFADLKKEVKQIGGDRIRAIEDAMVTGRRWSAAEFRALFLDHPLMWQLTHRLVWAATGEHGTVSFRVAEDRTFADLHDQTWQLDDTATVAVPHPWHLGDDRAAWSEIFADYAIIQPFPQLGRELATPGEVDLATFAGMKVDARKLFVLTSKGWRFGDDHTSVLRDWPQTVKITYTPRYNWHDPDQPKTLTGVRGCDGLGPVAFCEVVRDLGYLTS